MCVVKLKSSFRKLYSRHHDLVNRLYGISLSQITTDMFRLSQSQSRPLLLYDSIVNPKYFHGRKKFNIQSNFSSSNLDDSNIMDRSNCFFLVQSYNIICCHYVPSPKKMCINRFRYSVWITVKLVFKHHSRGSKHDL
jgi:hypothetical protein